MAGIPLKSGADFYNLEASRMRLHNLGADPTEFGLGQIYYNSSSGNNTSGRARLYTGTGFRSLAFMEDIAAIQEQLDLLSGEVDTDSIISNMKEVSAFLAGFAEDANLMDVLNGKLDKKGGTIEGPTGTYTPLSIKTTDSECWIGYYDKVGNYYIGIRGGVPSVYKEGVGTHAILTSAGGKVKDLAILGSGTSYLAFEASDGTSYGSIGVSSGHEAKFWDGAGAHTLLHSGNIGEYKAGGLVSEYLSDVNAAGYNKVFSSGFQATNRPSGNYATGLTIYNTELKYTYQLAFNPSGKLFTRYNDNSAWQDWKAIAFTDSTVAAANRVLSPAGKEMVTPFDSDSAMSFGSNAYRTFIDGSSITFRGSAYDTKMLINSSGNVTIGASDLAKANYKLYVKGIGVFEQSDGTRILLEEGAGGIGGAGIAFFNSSFQKGTITAKPLIINAIGGGNVLIGTTDDNNSGAKLQIDGKSQKTALTIRQNVSASYGEFMSVYNEGLINGNHYGMYFGRSSDAYNYGWLAFYYDGLSPKSNAIRLGVGGGADVLTINGNGNVLIGTTDDKGYKLNIVSNESKDYDFHVYNSVTKSSLYVGKEFWYGTKSTEANETAFMVCTGVTRDGGGGVSRFSIMGNGSTFIDGDLHVTGNIIADKEVSAGGAAEESGEGGGGTGGGVEPYVFTFTPSTTTVSVNHNISSEDVIVQVYEKDATSGKWSVILVDIEIVDSTRVDLHFGRTETTEHKVVIIG